MTRFERVKQILEDGVGDETIGAHGNFWRTETLDQFKQKAVFGQKLITVGDPDNSGLIKALEGTAPFGSDLGTVGATFRRMPAGKPPIPADQIMFLRQWITDGCPDDVLPDLAPVPLDPAAPVVLTVAVPPATVPTDPPQRRDAPELMGVDPAVRDLAWLQEALQVAVELELSTIPPYLCALWSIKDATNPVYALILGIALEEMLHMGLACNMLNAIGGTPKINTPEAVPKYPGPLPGRVRPGLIVGLSGLTRDLVHDVFMEIETPQNPPVVPLALALEDLGQDFNTIGDFYDAVLEAFRSLPPAAITGAKQLTATFDRVPVAPPEPTKQQTLVEQLIAITSLQDVETAISEIKEQGEGTSQSPDAIDFGDELAHYYRFAEIYHGNAAQRAADGTWGYTGDPIPFPEVWPVAPIPAGGYPDVTAAFDTIYTQLLDSLQAAWETGDNSVLSDAVGTMFGLKSIAKQIMGMPLPSGDGNYGPSFLLRR